MIIEGINIPDLAQRIADELGAWMLGQLGAAGLADAVHDHAPSEYHALTAEQRERVVQAVDKEIYG